MGNKTRIQQIIAVAVLTAPFVLMPSVSATPKDAEGVHKVTICHVTNSAKNPFVIIEVDVAAFDGEGRNDHSQHVNKYGDEDELFTGVPCGTSKYGSTAGDIGRIA